MKQIIMAALLISFSWGVRAQQLQIRGKVIDLSDKSPLEFVNITLQTAFPDDIQHFRVLFD